LIAQASREDLKKLELAFPDYVSAYLQWDRKTGPYANRKDEP
jgi:hypothetical protein